VQPLPVKGYNAAFQAPVGNAKTEGYVTLLNKSGGEMSKKSLPLNKKIREGYNDLQDIVDNVNERIEELLTLHARHEEEVSQVALLSPAKRVVVQATCQTSCNMNEILL
jgi:hypothetical protein